MLAATAWGLLFPACKWWTRKRPCELLQRTQPCVLMYHGRVCAVIMMATIATYFVWAVYLFVAGKCDVLGCGPGHFYKWLKSVGFLFLTHLYKVWRHAWLLLGRLVVNVLFLCNLLTADSCVAHLFPAKERVKFRHNYKLTESKNRVLLAPWTLQSSPFLPVQEMDKVYTACFVPFYLYTFRMWIKFWDFVE
jgi:hypothetical protein